MSNRSPVTATINSAAVEKLSPGKLYNTKLAWYVLRKLII